MIPVLNLVQSLRYSLRDMQGVNHSDYELIEVINQAASLLFAQLSEKHILYGLKKTILVVDDTGVVGLPSDFVKVHQVGVGGAGDDTVGVPTSFVPKARGTYRIIGDNFYALEGTYRLEYYYVPARVKDLADTLDAPLAMSPYIEQISLALYGNNLEKALQIVKVCGDSLVAREVTHFENAGPVQVLGGRI